MRKYYIPTTTLNFNNILSSESISPKAFYALRGFGYPSWESIAENNVDNIIILYEKPFGFMRPVSDLEDHPMLMEIQSNEDFPVIDEGIFYSDHTIFLSPWRTKFIFFSERDKQITLSRSDYSIETKLVDLYAREGCLKVEYYQNEIKKNVQLAIELNKEAIEKDYRINKMKGLLYGYYIGGVFSYPFEVVRQSNILQELQKISTLILSSDVSCSPSYRIKIYSLLKEYQRYTEIGRELQSLGIDWESIYPLMLILIHRWEPQQENDLFDVDDFFNEIDFSNHNNLLTQWLKDREKLLEQEMYLFKNETGQLLVYPIDKEINVSNLQLSELAGYQLDIKELEMIKNWVNHILLQKKYNGNISPLQSELSDEITIATKDVYGELWENCYYRQALNEMRRYVRMQDNKFDWNDYLISSIATVIVHGNDWNKLHDFAWEKGIEDYRMAFAFYGELNGFADLDRTFTDNLYNIGDNEYVKDVCADIHWQLLEEKLIPSSDESIEDINGDGIKTVISQLDNASCNNIKWTSWQDDIRNAIANEKIVKKNIKETMKDLEKAIKEIGIGGEILDFMNLLRTFESWHTRSNQPTKAWVRLKEYMDKNYIDD